MTIELLSAFVAFAFVSSITPGPNNLMLMASGANFGFQRTIPHMLGIGIGFTFMIVLVGAGLMTLFDLYPVSYTILKTGSVVYLLWLAWKIANASQPGTGKASGIPMSFLQAAAFQWVNPKPQGLGDGPDRDQCLCALARYGGGGSGCHDFRHRQPALGLGVDGSGAENTGDPDQSDTSSVVQPDDGTVVGGHSFPRNLRVTFPLTGGKP
ncbi:LysE type translocator [Aliiroseovarius sediminilitoris]|uniref:LysE type translocator n=1 Tax=Aliiroseovarius sediminilitoris TaxID=1173584 RepID=A0A1I0NCZ8_9RHOB|nr:LysE type translocator [Aliiroseovarius sediminilitoris]